MSLDTEQIFVVWHESGIIIYKFDTTSTPMANLILTKYDQYLFEEKDQHSSDKLKSHELLDGILTLTVNIDNYSQCEKFESIVDDELEILTNLLGESITLDELGKWTEVSPPYRNIRIGFSF